MRGWLTRGTLAVLVALVVFPAGSCRQEPPPPLTFDTLHVSVQNRTDRAWADVEIWVNDYYRAQAPTLLPGQVLDVPLDAFVAGFGQRFDGKRVEVYGIEVTSREGTAQVTRLTWGKGKKKF